MMQPAAEWREDIDALQFVALSHEANCMVHRLAFRRLLDTMPDAQACLDYFDLHAAAFQRAATVKASEQTLMKGRSFHLNSRDLRRQIGWCPAGQRLTGVQQKQGVSQCE